MYLEAISGQAAGLIETGRLSTTDQHARKVWERAAEDCVLARMASLRIVGGLPRHKPLLPERERLARLQELLNLWAKGCTCAVDEDLFADIVNRRKQ